MLYCEECGCCSGELGKSWVAYMCNDPTGSTSPASSSTAHPAQPPSSATDPTSQPTTSARGNHSPTKRPEPRRKDCKKPPTARAGERRGRPPATLERASNRGSSKVETTDRRARRTASPTRRTLSATGRSRGHPSRFTVVGCSSRASTRVGFKREPGRRGDGDTRAGSRGTQARGGRDPKRGATTRASIGATRAFPYRRARVYHGGRGRATVCRAGECVGE